MNRKKIWIFLTLAFALFIASIIARGSVYYPAYDNEQVFLLEWVFRDDKSSDIIGNPDFKPTFDNVNKETFIESLLKTRDNLGYEFVVSEKTESENTSFEYEVFIGDVLKLKYGEGFIVMSVEIFDENTGLFYEVLKTVCYTLSPEESPEKFPSYDSIEKFESYSEYFYPGMIDYRFYNEGEYEVHIEDIKMGH